MRREMLKSPPGGASEDTAPEKMGRPAAKRVSGKAEAVEVGCAERKVVPEAIAPLAAKRARRSSSSSEAQHEWWDGF